MTSRKEQKEAARAERRRKQEEAERAARRRRIVGYVAGGALALAAVAASVVALVAASGDAGSAGGGEADADSFPARAAALPEPDPALDLPSAAEKAGCKLIDPKSEGGDHTSEDVSYKAAPPHSGNHDPVPAEDGAYREAPRLENLVHSLEHGRVILWYSPAAPESAVADLKAIYDEDPAHMVIAPTEMSYTVAASAWEHVIGCDKWTEDGVHALRGFRDQYRDQGPEFVP